MPSKICSNCVSGKQRRNTYNHFFDGKFCQHCSLACRLAAHGEKREDIPKRILPFCAHVGCSNWAQRKGKLCRQHKDDAEIEEFHSALRAAKASEQGAGGITICRNCGSGKKCQNYLEHMVAGLVCRHCSKACRLAAHGESPSAIPKQPYRPCHAPGCYKCRQGDGAFCVEHKPTEELGRYHRQRRRRRRGRRRKCGSCCVAISGGGAAPGGRSACSASGSGSSRSTSTSTRSVAGTTSKGQGGGRLPLPTATPASTVRVPPKAPRSATFLARTKDLFGCHVADCKCGLADGSCTCARSLF